jgi:hypothetical protein
VHLAGLASVRDFVPVLGLILLWPNRPLWIRGYPLPCGMLRWPTLFFLLHLGFSTLFSSVSHFSCLCDTPLDTAIYLKHLKQ